jgi:AraC-like DNA-binding protein
MENPELKEKAAHGDLMFPLHVYHCDSGYKQDILDYHWHDEVEFIYLVQGKAFFKVGTTPVEVHPGQAIFVESGVIHSGNSLEQSHCIYDAIVFDPNQLNSNTYGTCQSKLINPFVLKQYQLPPVITGEPSWEKDLLEQLVEVIKIFAAKPWGYELAIKASLCKILSYIIINCQPVKTKKTSDSASRFKLDQLKKVFNFIKNNYQLKITVDDLSQEANLSNYHFSHFFKAMTGQSPIEYLNRYRINQAVRLLLEGNAKVMEIAYEVGFENFSYFVKTFKDYQQRTPSEIRKLMKTPTPSPIPCPQESH